MSDSARGRKFSDETLAKMKAVKMGSKHLDETRAKMAAAKSKIVVVTDHHTNEIKEYASQKAASTALAITVVTLQNAHILGQIYFQIGNAEHIYNPAPCHLRMK
ncbi:hypothetical protein HOY82DRAFT_619800 [Tuber indicum]|nr:hypothetical protein HOY82DRAFT_619800 [Tuber indicum]